MLNFPELEAKILQFWKDKEIFKKTLLKDSPKGEYSFYDGPPFATGLPHYGHIVASLMKDIVPRYFTMKGYYIERRWGWDCHGLPIENIVEKELGLEHKKDIENFGVAKFNQACASKVMVYAKEWRQVVERLGRWVDLDNDYKTMDQDYMESIWWVFKELWQKGLIYEGYKSMHICPRCETTLSQSEVAEGYQETEDISAIAKFELMDEPGTFILAWTTTPWTLPGNVALAMGREIEYVKVFSNGEKFILAKNNLPNIFQDRNYQIIETVKAEDLENCHYRPLVDYFLGKDLENQERFYTIQLADFVTLEDGTGVVHIAPAFGEDDLNLGKEKKLPFVQHVSLDGRFKAEVKNWTAEEVKPKNNPQATDQKIINYLRAKGLLFASEKYRHSYPFCWRCESPLLNYATSSWFVAVEKLKKSMLKLAPRINWLPEHIKEGRFGNWLANARDWSISRQRFWGSVMPVWICQKCREKMVFGSIEDLRQNAPQKITKLILVRHGLSEKNIQMIFDSDPNSQLPLTKEGEKQAQAMAKVLAKEKQVVIYTSPLLRARQTATAIAKRLAKEPIVAAELSEINNGNWEGKVFDDPAIQESRKIYKSLSIEEQYKAKRGEIGESWYDQEQRIFNFVKKIIKENSGQTIILVSHQGPLVYLLKSLRNLNLEEVLKLFAKPDWQNYAQPVITYLNNQQEREIDLHKHIIDEIEVKCSNCGGPAKRIPDVLDCWFESGSMPYAQLHYPFENQQKFEQTFPADFIAEGVDQTRAWFYYLHVLAVALKKEIAYKNVVVNGIVLAADGKKMSKRLNNYPDPLVIFDKYGADALRYYLTTSSVMRAEDLCFTEREVDLVVKKVLLILGNVLTFYQLYEVADLKAATDSENLLDRWIIAKTKILIEEITVAYDHYDLIKASRPLAEFINQLSTWYLRRSRERFKSGDQQEKQAALITLKYVLQELAKLMAPVMPFMADYLYQQVGGQSASVHLENWPVVSKLTKQESSIVLEMEKVRKIVELALAKRDQAQIKIRQPLAKVTVYGERLASEFQPLIKEEVNVKEVVFEKGEGLKVELDTQLSEELRAAGAFRELVRTINQLRKEAGLTIKDQIKICYQTNSEEINQIIIQFNHELLVNTLALEIKAQATTATLIEKEVEVNGHKIRLALIK